MHLVKNLLIKNLILTLSLNQIISNSFEDCFSKNPIRIDVLDLIYLLLCNVNMQILLEDLLLKYIKTVKDKARTFYLQIKYSFIHGPKWKNFNNTNPKELLL